MFDYYLTQNIELFHIKYNFGEKEKKIHSSITTLINSKDVHRQLYLFIFCLYLCNVNHKRSYNKKKSVLREDLRRKEIT